MASAARLPVSTVPVHRRSGWRNLLRSFKFWRFRPFFRPVPRGGLVTGRRKKDRARFSPLTKRLLGVNILALVIPVGGLLYLGQYQDSLIATELHGLRIQGEIFAGALAEGAITTSARPAFARGGLLPGDKIVPGPMLSSDIARPMLRRLVQPTRARARLFDTTGVLIADSRQLEGPGGAVEVEPLPPVSEDSWISQIVLDIYVFFAQQFAGGQTYPSYNEFEYQRAQDYSEAAAAMRGEFAHAVRAAAGGSGLVLSVAVPVQQLKQVHGVLLLTTGSGEIERAVREVRLDILKLFGGALALTVLLSLYLAGTIARPIRNLADSADRVRHDRNRVATIPDFANRRDEIGDLSLALRHMTDALWQRMDAIERFAADVAHEIKNPLTSLRSAVETAARIDDPDQQRKLTTIILEDVERLNRLITDISDASRLDAELSREMLEPVDIPKLLSALTRTHGASAAGDAEDAGGAPDEELGRVSLVLDVPTGHPVIVQGMESRLAQVFSNLIANALSFSPADGRIWLRLSLAGSDIEVRVEDEGPGIGAGEFESIFGRFYSSRPEAEKFGTHSGLGLSISRQIVENFGGKLWAENRIGAEDDILGARFIVRLPAA